MRIWGIHRSGCSLSAAFSSVFIDRALLMAVLIGWIMFSWVPLDKFFPDWNIPESAAVFALLAAVGLIVGLNADRWLRPLGRYSWARGLRGMSRDLKSIAR